MNRVFQVIYSEARNCYVVVSELAKHHGRSTHSCGNKSAALTAIVLSTLASFSWTGLPTAQAATRTEPMTVTEKNQTISDSFAVAVNGPDHEAILSVSASAGGKDTLTNISSNIIAGSFINPYTVQNGVMDAHGVLVHEGYTGKVAFDEGIEIRTTLNGGNFDATGISVDGVEPFYNSQGKIVVQPTKKANEAYERDGHIAEAYGNVGRNTAISLETDIKDAAFLKISGLSSHFAYMKAGDGLHISVQSGPADKMYISGIDNEYYGDVRLGNRNTIRVTAEANDSTKGANVSALYNYHDSPDEDNLPALTRQYLQVGDDTILNALLHSTSDNSSPMQIHGAYLGLTNFSLGNRLTLNTSMTGSGSLDNDDDSVDAGLLVWSSAGSIGNDFHNTVTYADGTVNRVQGVKINGLIHEQHPEDDTKLSLGKNSRMQVAVTNGTIHSGITGYQIANGGELLLDQNPTIDISMKRTHIAGYAAGIELFQSSQATLGKGTTIELTADSDTAADSGIIGIMAYDTSTIHAGDGYTSTLKLAHNQGGAAMVQISNESQGSLGHDAQESLSIADSSLGALGHDIYQHSTFSMGDKSHLSMDVHGNMRRHFMAGTNVNTESVVSKGNQGAQKLSMTGNLGALIGDYLRNNSKMTIGDGQANFISLQGNAQVVAGKQIMQSSLLVGNGQKTEISITGNSSTVCTAGDYLQNAPSDGMNLKAGDEYTTTIRVEGKNANVVGMYAANGAKASVGNRAILDIRSRYTGDQDANILGIWNTASKVNYGNDLQEWIHADQHAHAYGIFGQGAGFLQIGDAFSSVVHDTSQKGMTIGLYNYGMDTITVGKDSRIFVSNHALGSQVAGIKTTGGFTMMGDRAAIAVDSPANNTFGVWSSGGTVEFAGSTTIQVGEGQDAVYSTGRDSSVKALGTGRKLILGNLEAADHGAIQLKLDTADSLFRGQSILDASDGSSHSLPRSSEVSDYSVNTTAADTELTLANGARWDMTGSSQVTKLTHENGGLVNMAYAPSYQRLDMNEYSGKNGLFLMKTDLASQSNGDKVYMEMTAADSHGLVQVHDQSFLTGKDVTGTKHLLLITDNSRHATFSGQAIDEGGLWDVTPTIENGSYVRNALGVADAKDTEWYLTKLAKTVNRDTKPLIGAADYAYGQYRNDIETLRQRMGELRFLSKQQDASGIWARLYGGEFNGPGYDSRYHVLQIGYDYLANPKSVYGWFGERGISSPHYDYGTSSNHALAAGLYGTWFGDSGAYTDAVAKWGRDDVSLHTTGSYPDQAGYRTRVASLSLEYGKTLKLNEKGLFIEPQAQLVYGHLGSTHYMTARAKQVHMDDYDSLIGRIGFVFGKRTPEAEQPLDYYLRLSALHEFGGGRDLRLAAADGETMDWSRDYGSTWYEASLGGTYRLNSCTTLYGDVQRSFGSDWHKKWQGNIGLNWQF